MSDLRYILEPFNPWWDGNSLPVESGFKHKRKLFGHMVEEALDFDARTSVILLGPRRVGKTVLLRQIVGEAIESKVVPARNVCFVDMDNPHVRGIDPTELVRGFREMADPSMPCLVLMDEIQRCEIWEQHIKVLTDYQKDVKIIVTGSIASALKKKSTEAGTGRFASYRLPPVLFCEYLEYVGKWPADLPGTAEAARGARLPAGQAEALNKSFEDYIRRGSYPQAIFDPKVAKDAERYIQRTEPDRDLLDRYPSLWGIVPGDNLFELYRHIALRSGQEVSLKSISQDMGVGISVINKYLEYLEAAFLIRKVKKMGAALRKLQRNSNVKFILENPSAHLAHAKNISGHFVEATTMVQRQVLFDGSKLVHAPEFRYCRFVRNGIEYEVDMAHLWAGNSISRLCEIKWTDRKGSLAEAERNLKYLEKACDRSDDFEGVYCTTKSTYDEGRESRVRFLPTAQYCVSLGLESLE